MKIPSVANFACVQVCDGDNRDEDVFAGAVGDNDVSSTEDMANLLCLRPFFLAGLVSDASS